jgi:predicted nucleic acid-binding protein
MIVVDTTVLVYAVGEDHRLRDPCRRLIELVRDGAVTASTTVEVIQEFTHVRARRRTRTEAARLGSDLATLLSPLLRPNVDTLRSGLELFGRSKVLGAFDAFLAAAALEAGAAALVSADGCFANIPGLRHVDPADPDFEGHLARG